MWGKIMSMIPLPEKFVFLHIKITKSVLSIHKKDTV